MKTTLTTHEIATALKRDDNANWSYNGARALAEYLEAIEEDTGEEMEFDVVALRCDFTEYSSAVDAIDEFDHDVDLDAGDDDEKEEAALSWLRWRTQVIEFDGGVIIQNF